MWNKWKQIWTIKDLRMRIGFVLAMLILFRFAANIPIPGVDLEQIKALLGSNQFFGLLNVFSGGTLANFSIVLLGVGPYITSSIIFQLLASIVPRFQEMQKEGLSGQQKINQYTRIATVPLAILQGFATVTFLQKSQGILGIDGIFDWARILLIIVAGSMLLMWMGELITEKKVGNGVSLLIFSGIIAGLPQTVQQFIAVFDSTQLLTMAIFAALGIVTIAGVVFITEGQRKIPITYARQTRGTAAIGAIKNHLPLRVNQSGVIPIIFAISLVLLPTLLAQFLVSSSVVQVADAANAVVNFFNNSIYYGIIYFVLVFVFTYFYTAVIFKPDQIAENLQRQGAFIPGVRPGKPTEHYLQQVSSRILLAGALFLGIIAVLPVVAQNAFNLPALTIGGTSLLIVVSVVIESIKQIEAQIVMRDYETFS
ncbi:MAG: preprotein translocase subunit SecY [Candidatus Kerfeldbacteria bacterium RIFCSPHIGHO2_12_FULL_48_17]|uniref:Protein translocase subunit SecY n=1 Tax=Candidatus Kerfeldbacteria bacterium RIFCSPHIGHO2_12_FULL_48_17 TaxID=1798542 RepID=A0A1G2B5J8_9BACT|nr:MAG: preprotein translocase subunit SecY [Candidatus Kerfeldbacteria bacterium RIFCSPHIGHO2_12_FULL_48_17]